jgi:hypothetical protein
MNSLVRLVGVGELDARCDHNSVQGIRLMVGIPISAKNSQRQFKKGKKKHPAVPGVG